MITDDNATTPGEQTGAFASGTQASQAPLVQHFPVNDKKDYVQKELDQIQAIITRMGSNSFQCKGWAIGIVTIILVLSKDSFLLSGEKVLVLLIPLLVFWYLDAFFLYTEQRYRDLFNDVVKKRFNKLETETDSDWSNFFDFNYTRFEDFRVANSWIGVHFWYSFCWLQRINSGDYNKRLKGIIGEAERESVKNQMLIEAKAERRKKHQVIPTYFRVMRSKTLWPFYIVPLLFVGFAFGQGKYEIFGKIEEGKDPVTVKIDSTTLAPVLKIMEKMQSSGNEAPPTQTQPQYAPEDYSRPPKEGKSGSAVPQLKKKN